MRKQKTSNKEEKQKYNTLGQDKPAPKIVFLTLIHPL